MNRVKELEDRAELEGLVKGTKPFALRIFDLKIELCQEYRRTTCNRCEYSIFCKLLQEKEKLRREDE